MRSIAPLLIPCSVLVPVVTVSAEPMEGLYRVQEPYSAQQGRDEGLRLAFDTLVERLTGDAERSRSPALAALRANPQQLVTQYGVQNGLLMVDFDPATVQKRLRQAGMGVWGAERPLLLAWWLNQGGGGVQLVGDGANGQALQSIARHRGLPLVLPLADLDEQLAVTPGTVGDRTALQAVSARYRADALLGVLARPDESGAWQASWQVWVADRQGQGLVSAASFQSLSDQVMQAVNAWLAPQFIVQPAAAESLLLEVNGANVARFAELDRLLAPMNGQLVQVEGDRLLYRLEASPQQLHTQLSMAHLQEAPAPAALPAAGQPGERVLMRYRW